MYSIAAIRLLALLWPFSPRTFRLNNLQEGAIPKIFFSGIALVETLSVSSRSRRKAIAGAFSKARSCRAFFFAVPPLPLTEPPFRPSSLISPAMMPATWVPCPNSSFPGLHRECRRRA
jgi:hypothetical protein